MRQILVNGLLAKIVIWFKTFVPNDKASDLYTIRFKILLIYTVVANKGIGRNQNLASVGRVSEHFLIADHAGAEYHLTKSINLTAKAIAFVY